MFKAMNENNFNDEISELLLPELSLLFENRFANLSKDDQIDFSNMTKHNSYQLRKILEKHYINQKTSNSKLVNELFRIFTIYIYFDYFIVHKDDYEYLLTFRDEVLMKYLINNSKYHFQSTNNLFQYDYNFLSKSCEDLLFSLSMCDINKSKEISLKQINPALNNNPCLQLKKEDIKIYKDIYTQLTTLLTLMDNKTLTPQLYSEKIENIKQTFNLFNKDNFNFNTQTDKIFQTTGEIIQLLNQSNKSVLVSENKNNIHLILCDHIYYRFGNKQMLNYIISDLNKCKNNNNNDILINIIKSCENTELIIDLLNKLNNNLPYLIRYHMFDILFNLNDLDIPDDKHISKNEIVFLLNNLSKHEIPFKYFTIYFFDYVDENNLTKKILSNYSSKCAKKICNEYNNQNESAKIINEIEDIKTCLKAYVDTEEAINIVNKIVFWKYLDNKEYIEAIKIYNEIYLYNKNHKECIENKETFELIDDQFLRDNPCEINMLIFILFNNDNDFSFYSDLHKQLIQFEELPPEVYFILKYCEFLISPNENMQLIKEFFNYCFIQKYCPIEMCLTVLLSFRNKNIPSNYLDYNDISMFFDNIIIYENIIKNKYIEYANLFKINEEQIIHQINEIKDFLFELKSA